MLREEDLQCQGLKILQDDQLYTFTSDSVVLANFVDIKKGEQAVEIGSGCGVISILLSAKTQVEKIFAFEVQQEMAELATQNIKLNKLQEKITLFHDDISNFSKYLKDASVDVVFSNPPYMNSSFACKNKVKSTARHDNLLPPQKLCHCASKLLKHGGRFFLCYAPSRLSEIFECLTENNMQPKRMFFTQNQKGEIKLCFIEAVKNAKKELKILPNLTVNDADGKYLEQLHTKYFKA